MIQSFSDVDEVSNSGRRYGVFYYYHLPLLNHFFHRDFISISFFLLHDVVDTVTDVKEKMKKRVNYTILH